MSDDKSKKPKIDLKARLGKTMAAGAGTSAVPVPTPGPSSEGSAPPPSSSPSAVPPPPGMSGAPKPSGIAPPIGLSPGIPLPPFATRSAAPAPSKPVAAQQTIKVEVGEEIHEERRKASKRTAIYVAIGVVVGLGIGWIGGGAQERGSRGTQAQKGAGELEKDVKAANEKIAELGQKLVTAGEKLGNKEFPADLAKDLAATNVPFDAQNLDGKFTGSLPGKVFKALLSYTTAVQDLNKTKDSLKNLLTFAQPKIEKAWKDEKDPPANYAVIFRGDQKGTVAELVPLKEPFLFSKDWPESFTILKAQRTQQGVKTEEKKANRWKKGDLTGSDPIAIPIDAQSAAGLSGEEVVFKLSNAMRDIRKLIEGDKENPQSTDAGLAKEGDDLVHELHKVAIAK